MAEKVIFEFRADRDESSCRFEFGHDMDDWPFGPSIRACCEVISVAGVPHTGMPRRSRRSRDKARHPMRETLDLFERMYDDLFGQEEPGYSKDPKSD
jgi:hypothetical protein